MRLLDVVLQQCDDPCGFAVLLRLRRLDTWPNRVVAMLRGKTSRKVQASQNHTHWHQSRTAQEMKERVPTIEMAQPHPSVKLCGE